MTAIFILLSTDPGRGRSHTLGAIWCGSGSGGGEEKETRGDDETASRIDRFRSVSLLWVGKRHDDGSMGMRAARQTASPAVCGSCVPVQRGVG